MGRSVACLIVLVCAMAGAPGAIAAGATKQHGASASASATTPPAPSSLSGSPGGSLGGGLTAPGGVPTASSATPTVISTATASTAGGGGLSGSSAIGIAVGAFIVLGGISFFIWRDARRRAPVAVRSGAGDGADGRQNRPGSKAPPKARKLSQAERRRRKRGRAKR